MEVIAEKSFGRDFKKLDIPLKSAVTEVYELFTSLAQRDLLMMTDVTLMASRKVYYRYKLGDYRIGFRISENVLYLIRVLHRKEIYRYFP